MDEEGNLSDVLPQAPQLAPELKDIILRILLLILVDRYVEERERCA